MHMFFNPTITLLDPCVVLRYSINRPLTRNEKRLTSTLHTFYIWRTVSSSSSQVSLPSIVDTSYSTKFGKSTSSQKHIICDSPPTRGTTMSYRKDQYFSRTIIRCRVEITSLYRCICPLSSTKPKPTNSKSRRLHKTHIFCESPPTQGMMMSYRRGQTFSRTKFVFRVEITSLYRYIYGGRR